MKTTVTVECYLLLKPRIERWCGDDRVKGVSVDVRKEKPKLGPHDQSLHLKLQVPESLFFKPTLSASINVPEHDAPPVITPDVQERIAEIIRDQVGINLTITAPGGDDSD